MCSSDLAARYVHHSVAKAVTDFLDEYDWTGVTPPFGTSPVQVRLTAPKPADLKAMVGNTLFISFGDEGDLRADEMGGGMLRVEHVVFLDVVAVDESIGLAIASDLKDRLSGLFGGTRYLRPINPATGIELPGFLGEFVDVAREQPDGDRRNWHSVSCTLQLDFPGEDS